MVNLEALWPISPALGKRRLMRSQLTLETCPRKGLPPENEPINNHSLNPVGWPPRPSHSSRSSTLATNLLSKEEPHHSTAPFDPFAPL